MNTKKREIPWLRIFAEGGAIVVSILLAFAIDAWWDTRQEETAQRARMQTLLEEFRAAKTQLEGQTESLQGSLQGTSRFLELMTTTPDAAAADQSREAFVESMSVGAFAPQLGSLEDALTFRGSSPIGGPELWAQLQRWQLMMRDLEADAELLERNREERVMDAMIRLEVPLAVMLAQPGDGSTEQGDLSVPGTALAANLEAMLRDPGVNTVFTMRSIRTQLLIDRHDSASAVAEDIIKRLEQAL